MLMRRGCRLSLVAAASLCLWTPIAPADEVIDPLDLRCLIVALQIQKSDNAQLKASAPLMMMFYLGRLQHRNSPVDLFDPIVKAMSSWTTADLSSEAVRCGRELQDTGHDMMSVGQRLLQRSQKMTEEGTTSSATKASQTEGEQPPK